MATRVAINGFGRIGRAFLRTVLARGGSELEIVAINDLGDVENLAYLLQYDTVYGTLKEKVAASEGQLTVGSRAIRVLSQKDPAALPWKELGVDIVLESTGFFTEGEKAKAHLTAGAKRVVISAPGKGGEVATVLLGANDEKLATCDISSNASCTTNAASPLIGILDEGIGIERAILNTVHAYTATQALVDAPAKDEWRRGRAGAQNLVPSHTGAAKATTLAYESLSGKFDGVAVRVPVAAGSIVDVTFVAKRETTAEEVNDILRQAAGSERWSRVFSASDEPLVSSDILGLPYGSIADLTMTRVVDKTLVKVLAWYDNEMGYTHTLVEHVLAVAKHV